MKQTIKLSESELKRMIAESVKRVLREERDIDDDNYFGGGLSDEHFTDDTPMDDSIPESKIGELQDMLYPLYDIANNYDCNDYKLLYQAADLIEKFLNANKQQ